MPFHIKQYKNSSRKVPINTAQNKILENTTVVAFQQQHEKITARKITYLKTPIEFHLQFNTAEREQVKSVGGSGRGNRRKIFRNLISLSKNNTEECICEFSILQNKQFFHKG